MKLLLTTLIIALLAIPYSGTRAQSQPDTTRTHSSTSALANPSTQPDDEFNIFLLTIALSAACVIIGATIVGAAAATLFLLLLFTLVSAGIVSAGILIGLYRRSVSAAFKSILALICSITISIAGAAAFWIINRIFHIDLTTSTALLIGAFSGLLGGLLLSFTLTTIIRIFFNYCRQKLSI
jgi:hypothetical protein